MPLLFICVTYLLNVNLYFCGYWLLQNLEKRRKSNKFNRLQIEVFLHSNISPWNIEHCPSMHSGHINRILRYFPKIIQS